MVELHHHTFPDAFVTEKGARIAEPTIAYRTWGILNKERDNAVMVFHALTGNPHADAWFSGLFGPGKTLDPERHFIVCANVPGSCYGSSGPASTRPDTGQPYRADFPEVTIRDMVRFQQQLLDMLGVRELEFIIGGSLGGMQALEFAIMDDRPRAAICIGMGKAHSPWAIGIGHAQRQAIMNDPNWNDGYYSDEDAPVNGLSVARMMAMNSYRTPADFNEKFGRRLRDDSEQFEVTSYLDYQGEKLAKRFDAVAYVRLTQAMDSHDVARGRGSYAEVLGQVSIPVHVIGIDTDLLYPSAEQKELAELLRHGTYSQITSPHGHDAFLIEFRQIHRFLKPFLTTKEHADI